MLSDFYPEQAPFELINPQDSPMFLIDLQVFPLLINFLHFQYISSEAFIHSVKSGTLSKNCLSCAQETISILYVFVSLL